MDNRFLERNEISSTNNLVNRRSTQPQPNMITRLSRMSIPAASPASTARESRLLKCCLVTLSTGVRRTYISYYYEIRSLYSASVLSSHNSPYFSLTPSSFSIWGTLSEILYPLDSFYLWKRKLNEPSACCQWTDNWADRFRKINWDSTDLGPQLSPLQTSRVISTWM